MEHNAYEQICHKQNKDYCDYEMKTIFVQYSRFLNPLRTVHVYNHNSNSKSILCSTNTCFLNRRLIIWMDSTVYMDAAMMHKHQL